MYTKIQTTFNKIVNVIQVAWGRTPLLIMLKQPEEDIDWIRQAIAEQGVNLWRTGRLKILRELMRPVMWIMWPFRAVIITGQQTKIYGVRVKSQTGKAIVRQLKEQLVLAFRDQVSPELYYLYRCYQDEVYVQAKYFLNGCKISTLQAYLNNHTSDEKLHDKLALENRLRENDIPVVDSIAIIESGKFSFCSSLNNQLPAKDLLVKPNQGKCGQDIQAFYFRQMNYLDESGKAFDQEQLKKYLIRIAEDQAMLVQPLLKNHHDFADLGNGALSTIRILTGLSIHNEIEVISASFKMACGASIVDNFSTNGIASAVDINTGKLSSAVAMKVLSPFYHNHPNSGECITGRELPDWNKAKIAVIRAHALLRPFVFLAWDVAITSDGPVIIESNADWGAEVLQLPLCQPLGQCRFAEISAGWIKQKKGTVKVELSETIR